MNEVRKGRVLGVGGIFFRSKAPDLLGAWDAQYLGLQVESWGTMHGTNLRPRTCQVIRLPFGAHLRQIPNISANPVRCI